jgi:hypothetical protein
MYRNVFDFVQHPLVNRVRDIPWEDFLRKHHAPFGVIRCASRQEALDVYHRMPQHASKDVVDSWEFLQQVVIPLLRAPASEVVVDFPTTPTEPGGFESDAMVDAFFGKCKFDLFGTFAVEETLRFLYDHMRCGIVVRVVRGKIVCFCPFYNPDFTNKWPAGVPSGADAFKDRTALPVGRWWANGGILCTEAMPWGSHFLMQIKDLIAEAAATFATSDVTFCINKRDFPQWKYNATLKTFTEPYGFLFDRDDADPFQDIPLATDFPAKPLPMFSFYGGERFADILFPPTEDWEAACKCTYLPSVLYKGGLMLTSVRDLTRAVPEEVEGFTTKKDVLFFRGSATGSGTTALTNSRLLAFERLLHEPNTDVRCTSIGRRLHKHFLEDVAVVGTPAFPVSEAFYVPMAEQQRHKFLLYIEGHCAACRLGVMLASGCVVFKTTSTCVASELWFTHLLQENVHYVSIASDLSDVTEKVQHYLEHPDEAQRIATNARAFWETYLSKTNLVRYVGGLLAAYAT